MMGKAAIDGFDRAESDAFTGYDAKVATSVLAAVDRVAQRLHVEVGGIKNLPTGPALLVSNHTFGWDVAFAVAAIRRTTGRHVWSLGEHAWWAVPWVRRLATRVGVVDGTPENGERLLRAGALVLVLPGGLREAMKPYALRYRLLWGGRHGFARLAIRCGVPIVPLAAMGADEVFHFVDDAFARGDRWLGRHVPIPKPTFWLPIPHAVHLRYELGAPIVPRVGPESEGDDVEVTRLVHEVRGALDELLTNEMARRSHVCIQH